MPINLTTQGMSNRDEMPKANSKDNPRSNGEICIRSNVCADQNAWNLVPGDLLKHYGLPQHNITKKQHDEMMYYIPCCICHRSIFEINEDGCDNQVCRDQGIPSRAESERRRATT